MNIIDIFLNELSHRIQDAIADVNDINNQRNNVLEIENILFNREINKLDLTVTSIIKLEFEDFSRIKNFIGEKADLGSVESFLAYKNIMRMQLDNDTVLENTPAFTYLSRIVNYLSSYLKEYNSANTDRLTESKDRVNVLKRFLAKFKAGVLAEPIIGVEDVKKFHQIVDLSSLAEEQKALVKKYVGQASIILVANHVKTRELNEPVKKYSDFVDKKNKRIKKYIKRVKEFTVEKGIININLDNAEEILHFIAHHHPEISFRNIQSSVVCLLLTNELSKYEEFMTANHDEQEKNDFVKRTVDIAESIMLIMNIKGPKKGIPVKSVLPLSATTVIKEDIVEPVLDIPVANEEVKGYDVEENLADLFSSEATEVLPLVTPEKEIINDVPVVEDKELNILDEAKDLIEQINMILKTEDAFLKSINPDDYSRYTELLAMISETAEPDDKTRFAIIIESLRLELDSFKIVAVKYTESPKEFRSTYGAQKKKIKEYLEVYKLLKSRIGFVNNESENRVLYLADTKNQSVMLSFIEDLTDEQKASIEKIHSNIIDNNLKGSKKLLEVRVEETDYDVMMLPYKGTVITYIDLSGILLILMALKKSNKVDDKVEVILNTYNKEVQEVMMKAQKPEELDLLYDEQANIRTAINNYFGEIVRSK